MSTPILSILILPELAPDPIKDRAVFSAVGYDDGYFDVRQDLTMSLSVNKDRLAILLDRSLAQLIPALDTRSVNLTAQERDDIAYVLRNYGSPGAKILAGKFAF